MPPRKKKPPKPPTPKKVNPWDASQAQQGDSNEEVIYRAVGKALTDWEFVEEELAHIFAALVGSVVYASPGPVLRAGPAVRAYGSIVGLKARLDMLRAAGESYFQSNNLPQFQVDFGKLMEECGQWSNRRNDIAHARVWSNTATGCLLFPALYSTKKYKSAQPPAYSYSSKEIAKLSAGFQDLYDRLADLAVSLDHWNRAWSQPQYVPRDPHPRKKDQTP